MARSFREAGHLPHNREDGQPRTPQDLPRQRNGITPQMHGRYPDFNVLDAAGHWDPVTRETVLARAHETPPVRFFDAAQERCLRAFCDIVMAQDAEPRIPVLEMVDQKLHEGRLDGYQHAHMPDDRETWRRVAAGLDQEARRRGAAGFAAAGDEQQRAIVRALADGDLHDGIWEGLDASTAWSVVMRAVLSAFYSHPWAWNEIGFAGPAYPRGYMRLQPGPAGREPHEAPEAFETDPVVDVPARGLE